MPNADSGIAGELHSLHLMSNRLLVVSGKLKKTFYWVYLFSLQEFTECGQDVGKFKSYIDVVLPMSYYKDWDFTPSWVYGKNSGILYDTQKKAKNTSIIPTFDLPSSTQKDSYKTIFKKTQKNYPKIKCINYFIYGKWKESHFKKIVYY